MKRDDIKKFPEHIRKQIDRQLSEGGDHSSFPADYTKPIKRTISLGTQEIPRLDTPCHVSVHSIRKGSPDLDGVSAKAVIDGVVSLGILPDDRKEYISRSPVYTFDKASKEVTIITLESEEKDVRP